MKLYNTLTKQIEEFIPNEKGIVKMYTCGPTVYHFAHIGNLRTYIFEDILEKSLTYLGYKVDRVMNITDVGHLQSDGDVGEDKMLIGAKREGKTVYEIADFYTNAFFDDAQKLNIKKPNIIKKASDQIEHYIKIITDLINKDYAYISNGNVYFDISKAKDYYKLSGKKEEELIIGARDDVTIDESKRNPFDFVLWFTKSKFENQAMIWDSPWGRGYPGWHIECSTIASTTLGEYLDIHCGGVDNIFPHHTNEIAQSEAYLGHKWCNYWIHGEHLNDISGKMAKSKGEFLTISLLINKGYNPLAYRFMCLQSHYRKQLLFTYESLDIASQSYNKLKSKINSLKKEATNLNLEVIDMYKNKFKEALEDNLNTSNALTVLFDVLKDEVLDDYNKLVIIEDFDRVLSLDLTLKDNNIPKEIEDLVNERNIAKTNKDFSKSDEIRDKLLSMGYTIKDTRDGTIVERR
ncbi:MAG: cysteine--tRNA ligase [Tenericutes bacterium]|nr:cysteine--tRNA ligase [Mycoplasmatota bacterium]